MGIGFVVIVYTIVPTLPCNDFNPLFLHPLLHYSSLPPSLLSFAPVAYRNIWIFAGSDSQDKFAVSFARIQHPMRRMDIREIVDVGWSGDPISVLDMAYNILQRHI